MAKDRNTMAKRQREAEKRRKAEDKRARRSEKKSNSGETEGEQPEDSLTAPENAVFKIFREYLMTPGKMLCLNSPQLETLREPLKQLTEKGLLVDEQRHGGYSLTQAGYAAMNSHS